jgi:hypothetical protein
VSQPDLKDVISAVQLDGIRLVQLSATTDIREPSEAGAVNVPVSWQASVEMAPASRFFVRATVEARVVPREAPQKPVVRVKMVFELAYRLPDGMNVSEEVLAQFGSTNGVFNAWPYARQLAHDTSLRMGLPPLVLPLLRIPELQSEPGESDKASLPPPEATTTTVRPKAGAGKRSARKTAGPTQ